jgi:hypothetical protein
VIDDWGLPRESRQTWTKLSPPYPAVVKKKCQVKVGGWGYDGDEGGHLIGGNIGGYGGRANLAPQNPTLNHGQWNRVANTVSFCANRGYWPTGQFGKQ